MALTYLMKARMMSTRKVAARMISVFSSRPRLPNDALRLSKPSSSWGRSKIALKNSQIGIIFLGVFLVIFMYSSKHWSLEDMVTFSSQHVKSNCLAVYGENNWIINMRGYSIISWTRRGGGGQNLVHIVVECPLEKNFKI